MIKLVRYDESNSNKEALKGKYGQEGKKDYCITVIKNLVIVNLYNGCKSEIELPVCYDGFIQCSNGDIIQVTDSKFTTNLEDNVNGTGILVLKAWN